jgi:hypothetical protein
MSIWKHNLFRFGRKRWHKPAEKNSRGESAEELRYYKPRRIDWPNSSKRVCERSREGYCGIREGVEAVNQYAPVM